MKSLFLALMSILLLPTVSVAQTKIIASELDGPQAITLHESDLYVCENNTGNILKYDLNIDPSSSEFIVGGITNMVDIASADDTLYVVDFSESKIVKIDLTQDPIVAEDFLIDLSSPSAICVYKDELYYYEFGFLGSSISKINLNDPTIGPELVCNVPGIFVISYSMTIKNDVIYFTDAIYGKISSIDLMQDPREPSDLITGLSEPRGIRFMEDELIFVQSNSNLVSKVDINDPDLVVEDIVTTVDTPYSLAIDGENIYICEFGSNLISRFPDDPTLFVDHKDVNFKFYPNPAKDFIKIEMESLKSYYRIFGQDGKILMENTLNRNGEIDIRNLNQGVYFIKIDNSQVKTFIKE